MTIRDKVSDGLREYVGLKLTPETHSAIARCVMRILDCAGVRGVRVEAGIASIHDPTSIGLWWYSTETDFMLSSERVEQILSSEVQP